jgi:hypothetical protein
MTLPDLLEELKQVDPETYRKWFNDYDVLGLDQWQLDSLQGCIQRACERRGWPFHVAYYPPEGPTAPYYQAYIWPALKCHTAQADSAAEALLAAYIAAVKEEKQ